MISFIVSSYRENLYQKLVKNLAATVASKHEVVRIENHSEYSLSRAYNMGAKKAKYPYLCFIHEDVRLENSEWDEVILKHLHSKEGGNGLIGIAGSKIFPCLPVGWTTGIPEADYHHLVQVDESGNSIPQSSFPTEVSFESVLSLDGVFLFTSRSVWEEVQFNESIKGYHFYDLDFSHRASEKYDVEVTSAVELTHFSKGNFGQDWTSKALDFTKVRKTMGCEQLNKEQQAYVRVTWYRHLSKFEIQWLTRWRYLLKMGIDGSSFKLAMKFLFN